MCPQGSLNDSIFCCLKSLMVSGVHIVDNQAIFTFSESLTELKQRSASLVALLCHYMLNNKLTQTASRVGPDPAHIWPTWISHGPDVGRIWAKTMLLSGYRLLYYQIYCKRTGKRFINAELFM